MDLLQHSFFTLLLMGLPDPYEEAHRRSRPLRRRKERPPTDAIEAVRAVIARALA